MKQQATLQIPLEHLAPAQREALPTSDIASIRFMFHEMNRQYLDLQPATYYYSIKRAMDITISLVFIVCVMSWLTPLLALIIKLSSKGPVFFIQRRTGLRGEEFMCFKFRTMYLNDEADKKQVAINDKRITKIGRLLRLTHLDETPQFINVMLGEMSIVGPRPHMVYHTEVYSDVIPHYHLRLEVKPGMTGMAQIKDYVGEINEERELRKRIQWDVYYLKNRSIALDIRILFTTGMKIFGKIFHPFRKKLQYAGNAG